MVCNLPVDCIAFRQYSELISKEIATGGPYAAKSAFVRAMRSVKRSALKLLETFVETLVKSDIVVTYIPRMLDPILGDYNRNVPDARFAFTDKDVQLDFRAHMSSTQSGFTYLVCHSGLSYAEILKY